MNAQIRTTTRLAAAAALLIAGSAVARAEHYEAPDSRSGSNGHWTADGNLVDVSILVEGNKAPLYFRPGTWDRHYFQAMKGKNYSLVLNNNTGRRIGVLIAVDGLNVVNGEHSRLAHDEPMYVLDPHERATIRGWRSSLDDVRRFVFVDEQRSYAERTGQANGDMGWIRVLSFREVQQIGWRGNGRDRDDRRAGNYREEIAPRDNEAQAPRARGEAAPSKPESAREGTDGPTADALGKSQLESNAPESNPGTGWGDRRRDPVRQIQFQAERGATDHLVMRYEYASGLRALSIFPRRPRLWDRESGQLGFAKPPRR